MLTTVRRRGLVIEILTDKLFFDSGSAQLKPEAAGILDKIAVILSRELKHPIVVEGNTDSQPIGGSQYPSNWELSGARAAAVVRDLRHPRRQPAPHELHRLRLDRADRIQLDGRRTQQEPPRRRRPLSHQLNPLTRSQLAHGGAPQ